MSDAVVTPLLLGASLAWPDGRLTAASVTLIRSKVGATILVDTGAWHQRKALIAALDKSNVQPSHVDAVVLTHLHWDHCMNFDVFEGVPIVCSRTEWQRLSDRDFDHATPVYLQHLLDLHGSITVVDPGEFLGIDIIAAPGHTSGHIAVGFETEIGSVAIVGDAIPTRSAAFSGMPHAWHASEMDAGQSLSDLLEKFDVIIPGHDAPFTTSSRNGLLRGPQRNKGEGRSDK